MTKLLAALVVIALAASSAAAQAPPTDLPLASYLEKRVPDELAAEGKLLSRQNLALKIEQAGTFLVVSLVALDTGRVAASTKVDQVPADREAAVASVTHVAADLIAQVAGRPPIGPDAQAVLDAQRRALDDERTARQADHQAAEARELATLKYQKEMIRFTATYDLYANKNGAALVRKWVPFRGELEQHLDPHEFYNLVGRPELAEQYDHRRNIAIGGFVAGSVALVASLVVIAQMPTSDNCPLDGNFSACLDAQSSSRDQYLTGAVALMAAGSIGYIVGVYYTVHPHPISEDEAKSMAAAYNDGLRRNYGLPVVRRPVLHDVRIAPFLASNQGGLSLAARF